MKIDLRRFMYASIISLIFFFVIAFNQSAFPTLKHYLFVFEGVAVGFMLFCMRPKLALKFAGIFLLFAIVVDPLRYIKILSGMSVGEFYWLYALLNISIILVASLFIILRVVLYRWIEDTSWLKDVTTIREFFTNSILHKIFKKIFRK